MSGLYSKALQEDRYSNAKYVAFLRAINVGGHTIKMDHLSRLFEEMGFSNIATFIASGNVIFDSDFRMPDLIESNIEKNLKSALGYDVAAFVRSFPELVEIAACNPFDDERAKSPTGTLYIAFLKAAPGKSAAAKLRSIKSNSDLLHIHGREIFWLCKTRMMESLFSGALLEKITGMPTTIRNSSTVKKIVAKYP